MINVIVVAKKTFLVDSVSASKLASSNIRSNPYPVFSDPKRPNQNKQLVGPFIITSEDACYLYKHLEEAYFYSINKPYFHYSHQNLRIESRDKNCYKNPRLPPISECSLLADDELDEIFDNLIEPKKFLVYSHFRNLGYYLSSGACYGMHYLAYNAHPENLHSTFTIYVWQKNTPANTSDLSRMCRSATTVRKNHILAEVNDPNKPGFNPETDITYTLLHWEGSAKMKRKYTLLKPQEYKVQKLDQQ